MIRAAARIDSNRTAFTNGTSDSVADIPVEKGGEGNGFGPHELLEAALATCIAITVRLSATKHGFPLHEASCEVRIDRSVPDRVTLRYALSLGGPLSAQQDAHLRAAAARCPVAKTLGSTLIVEETK